MNYDNIYFPCIVIWLVLVDDDDGNISIYYDKHLIAPPENPTLAPECRHNFIQMFFDFLCFFFYRRRRRRRFSLLR